MSWIQTGRILLVWPVGGRVLNRKLDLSLVSRHAASMGAQLALVTGDEQVRFYAHQLEIPVFDDPRQAQEAQWSSSGHKEFKIQENPKHADLDDLIQALHPKTPAWSGHPAIKTFCLTISVLALFALAIFILPSAKVIFSPQVESQSMVFDLIPDPAISTINYSTGSLPTYIQEVTVEGKNTMVATGSVTIPDKPATGNLSFTNESDHTVSIPAGTIVTTIGSNPVRFITTSLDDTRLDANKSIVLVAQAIEPGTSGNLGPYELESIVGELDPELTVTNPAATTGGTAVTVPSPTAQDMSSLHQRLLSKLLQEAILQMQASIPQNDILITPTNTNAENLAESSFPSVGEPGNQIEFTLKLRVQAQVVSATTLHSFINPIMDSYTPKSYSPVANSLEITQLGRPTLSDNGKAAWTIRATRQVQADIFLQQAAGLISGRTTSQAIQQLSSALPLAEQPSIILSPRWWPRLPYLAMRIELVQAGSK